MENILSTNSFSSKVRGLKVNHDRATEGVLGQKISEQAHAKNDIKKTENTAASIKQQHNASILQANMNFSVSAGNESLALLYKTAIEGINDVLQAEFGDNAIQNAYDSGLDISPEATADRIVSMSTAFFSIYREQNSEMSDEEAAQAFAEIIGGGIDTGFAEAREVLDGLDVLEGDIASNIDTTYDLVQNGLLAFVNSYVESKEDEPA
jgi:hypothetical protein